MGDEYEYYDYEEAIEDQNEWEVEAENAYVSGKGFIDTDSVEARRLLQEVITLDEDHGQWTFKAKKMLLRLALTTRDEKTIVDALGALLNDGWRGRTSAMLEKALVKFLDRGVSLGISSDLSARILRVVLDYVVTKRQSLDKLYFVAHIRMAGLEQQRGQLDGLTERLEQLLEESLSGDGADLRRGSLIVQILALLITVTEATGAWEAYARHTRHAVTLRNVLPPARILGIVREAEGRLAAASSQWDSAREAFLAAFRAFDDAADARRVPVLALLVSVSMLATGGINPFQTNEGRSYANDPNATVLAEIFEAFASHDPAAMRRLMDDARWAAFATDRTLRPIQPTLLELVQQQAMVHRCRPFNSVRLSTLATMIAVGDDVAVAEAMVCRLLRKGMLHGRINALEGVLYFHRRKEVEGDSDLLCEWMRTIGKTHRSVLARLPDVPRYYYWETDR